ncbi:putative tyrosine-protein phosphatase [Wickerhamomyces ciferrii]|uniref:Tyrosine-protein phosphatase n=1 Tax=Wickerhamomyces ciferrii (strain ATCC 14091 / BCRC 22168 / CBS 111 / JCM 3599 / NBRC 0793 / NRRL Y-1031 F-60-10) TaxID=1206466 RepID=K0KQ55_WICCF|nr:putative tyrosine-protein phosphatase [Wickerhamomyces ciferrii]CCH43564.1 putative tyrosine-protein phosphatase [Wickerhamomyces ciferrii]
MTVYVPPLNFSLVEDGIYRSGHPVPINFPFLQTLNLKTVIYLGDKTDNFEYYKFLKSMNINFVYIHMESSSEPFIMNDPDAIIQALKLIINIENYPILIHSNKGKHRIGVLVGIMRKLLQGWSMTGIFNEYDKFAGGKGDSDIEFIEVFQTELEGSLQKLPSFVRLDH